MPLACTLLNNSEWCWYNFSFVLKCEQNWIHLALSINFSPQSCQISTVLNDAECIWLRSKMSCNNAPSQWKIFHLSRSCKNNSYRNRWLNNQIWPITVPTQRPPTRNLLKSSEVISVTCIQGKLNSNLLSSFTCAWACYS